MDARELILLVLNLSNLPAVLSFGETCSAVRYLAIDLAHRLYCQILRPFVTHHIARFNQLLTCNSGIITGSCAITMLLNDPNHPNNDLNIIMPYGHQSIMDKFIVDTLHYTRTSPVVHPVMANSIHTFQSYSLHGQHITLSESKRALDILHIVVNSPTTSDMTILTPGAVATLYPELMLNGVTLYTHTGQKMSVDQHLGSFGSDRFRNEKTTQFLDHPCGLLCPNLWRNVSNHAEYVLKTWDAHYNLQKYIVNNDLEWRLCATCQNDVCPFRAEVINLNTPIPCQLSPSCHEDVKVQMDIIHSHLPVCVACFFLVIRLNIAS